MKKASPHIASILPVAALALFLGASGSVLVDSSSRAHAAFSAEVLSQYTACITASEFQQDTCNAGCCFLGLCLRRCLDRCAAEDQARQIECSSDILGISNDGAFFDAATLARNGRTIRVGGPLQCPEGATADLDVTLTQSGRGALATGHVQVPCLTSEPTFSVDVHTIGRAKFHAPDQAQACGTARIQVASHSLDAFQWCRQITILPEAFQLED